MITPAAWRACMLAGLITLLLVKLVTGQMIYYIHPSFIPLQWFSIGMLALFAVIQLANHRVRRVPCYLSITIAFLIPLLLAIYIPSTTLGADTVKRQGFFLEHYGEHPVAKEELVTHGYLRITDENFNKALSSLGASPPQFAGVKVEMTGFVAKADWLAVDEFLLARLLVTCHVAHAQPRGLVVKYENSAELKTNQWVTVRGTLRQVQEAGE